jgi:hypothetical protein
MLLLATAAAFTAPAAFACPEGSLQETVSVMVSIGQHGEGVDAAEASASIDAITSACRDNPHVLKASALARSTLADLVVDKPTRLRLRQAALADFDRAVTLVTGSTKPAPAMLNGQPIEIAFDDNADLRAALQAALEEDR